MSDALRINYINSLPQPFFVCFYGQKDWWWPVYDIGTDVPIVRIDVMGRLQRAWFSDIAQIRDADGNLHDPDDWWTDDQGICEHCMGSGESGPDQTCWTCNGTGADKEKADG